VLGGLAEFERSLILSRTQAGIQRARERGVAFGRPTKLRCAPGSRAGVIKIRWDMKAGGGPCAIGDPRVSRGPRRGKFLFDVAQRRTEGALDRV
jgi:hypothetical protein